jgi:hypothetical protein
MNISAISMLPMQGPTDPARLADDPARLAKEFDAMVLRLLLGDLGKSMGREGELLGPMLAEQLAATVELGLGAALVREATEGIR